MPFVSVTSTLSSFGTVNVLSRLYDVFACRKQPETEAGGAEPSGSGSDVSVDGVLPAASAESRRWFEAVKDQDLERVRDLLEAGVPVNTKDEHDWSALHIGAWNGYTELCQLLLGAEADLDLRGAGGCTPLALSCQQGHADVVSLLLSARCDVNRPASLGDSGDVTALHLAAQHGHAKVVRLLLEAGAVVNAPMTARGVKGVTPLHLAVQANHLQVMDILIAAGCDVHRSTQPDPSSAPPSGTASTSSQNDVSHGSMESSC